MKTCFRLSLFAAILLWIAWQPTKAQPVQNGYMAVTCYSLGQPTGSVVALIDVRLADQQPVGQNWATAPVSHGPASSPWDRAHLGEVFGVTFDLQGNIYVAASTVYSEQWHNNAPSPAGPSGNGAIYQLDKTTGAISTFATLPNNGSALGNLDWDKVYNQVFVTNFEDGMIYRYSSGGTLLSTFDPFNPDGGSSKPAPLGERIWGIGVYDNRVYFSRWNENCNEVSFSADNEIWSVALDATGDFMGTEQLEIVLPTLPSQSYSNPVSDISFSAAGDMLLNERSMSNSSDFTANAHDARVLEYFFNGANWVPTGDIFSIGIPGYSAGCGTFSGPTGYNSAGGGDYAYDSYDPDADELIGCDEAVWVSGDLLLTSPTWYYGFQRLPASGGDAPNSVIIDAGAPYKTDIGDVEIFKNCDIIWDCDGVEVSVNQIDVGDCCYNISINGIPSPSPFTSVSATLLTAGVTFSGVIGPSGWNVTNSGTTATWDLGGTIPSGNTSGLEVCISTTVSAPQQVLITLYAADGTVCEYTFDLDCEPPAAGPCVVVNDDEIECKGNGPNGWTYEFSFTVTNYSPFSQGGWNLPAETLMVYGSGMTITPSISPLVPSLSYGQTSGTLTYTLTGAGLEPGDTACIQVQLHGAQVGDDYRWCCPPEMFYFVLPPCHDCCDTVDIAIRNNSGRQVGNAGAAISSGSITVTPDPIMKVQASIMNVSRSRVWCPDATGAYVPVSSPTSIGALITGGSISPAMPVSSGFSPATSEVIWGTVYSGVNFSGGSVNLNLSFPGTNLGWRCQDTLTVCVRYTFTDTACRTCDTVIYYTIPRCGRVDIAEPSDDVPLSAPEVVQGEGISVGEPLYSDVVEGPALDLVMSDHSAGRLAIAHWWQGPVVVNDKIRVVRVHVIPEPGIDIETFRSEEGAAAEVIDRAVSLDLDLNEGETDYFNITFDNPNNADFFALRVTYDYVDMDDPDIERLSREFIVYGDLTGDATQGRISVSEADKSTPTLYKLLIGSNGENSADWIAPACFRFTPPEGVRILASGPMPDSTFAEFHVLKSMSRESSMLLQLPSPGDFRKEYIAEEQSVALWLVLEGGGNLLDLDWEALNMNGEIIGAGDVQLSPTSTVYDGTDYVPGASIHLLETYPNPARDRVMTRFNLARTEEVSVGLYDLSGREITRLVDNVRLGAGSHEYELNLKSLSSGAYYIRLTTSAGTQTKSVVKQ